jgi:cyclopropane fatty-acyl-phospholipid synthase-like methyltransferase
MASIPGTPSPTLDVAERPLPGAAARLWSILTLTPVTTSVWLGMIGLAALLVAALSLSWVWLPLFALAVLAVHETLAFTLFHRGLFPSSERVARVYQWFTLFLGDSPDLKQRGDLTEGLFEGDFEKTIEQATLDKYRRIVELLGLQPGMHVLDVGCGLGDFLAWLGTQGISGTGLTLSPDQQRIGAARGLDVRVQDFRQPLPPELVGKFDAVTLIGSLEHFCTSYEMADRARADAVLAAVFGRAAQALKPQTPVARIFSATLHSTAPKGWTVSDWLHAYSFHAHYSGLYPRIGDFDRLCAPWFRVIHRQDTTVDYHYSSIRAAGHFGAFRVRWSAFKIVAALLLPLVNPFALWSWLYHGRGSWLWQFGGRAPRPGQPTPARALWYVHERLPDGAMPG